MPHKPLTLAETITLLENASLAVPGRIQANSVLDQLEFWDSMSMLNFISLIENRTGITLKPEDLLECPTPQACVNFIHKRMT